jgi:uncharacterized protein (DUF2062 family)
VSSGNAERFSPSRVVWLRRVAIVLGVLLVPHALLTVELHWPPGLVSIHVGSVVFAGLAALVISCTRWLAQRWDDQRRAAVQEGRAAKFDEKFADFEQRID